ncbi:MAG: DUF2815 domain-containing protein [Candidatus Liberibacter europaeus]|uniref:DUF2815 domain-containing protein n=1 Tax=Candidatus Liberibacter europaeus TaxID=744859 RepID=A0A2T4VWN4_9HYPH|nr:DUF2815 domain-containing protein [Candidatus Liberibacter europaeus]MBY7649798.1 DUF2815 domain-containing protein [Candidatus Liberibacter europaeus]PTL86201.1 MAG: DUF2815 domain-containing protein [Candidatus Liberibacter europaeus]PTL86444.1 MAG: DUF2815 domain-containing protein [Candidatus Liberibacter europaeus]
MQSINVKGRLSYPALDKMVSMTSPDGKSYEYYGADIIIPKSDTTQLKAIMDVMKAAVKEAFPNADVGRFIENAKVKNRIILKDGDAKIASASKPEVYEKSYTNCMYISAKNKITQPLLIDRQVRLVSNPKEVFYPGCHVIAKLNILAYELETYKTKGLSCTLTGVQFFKNDERWGSSPKADHDDFENYGDEEDETTNSTFASAELNEMPW